MENYALYSNSMLELPEHSIKNIAKPSKFYVVSNEEGSKSYHYEWPDLKIKINLMPQNKIADHLQGFAGYIQHLYSLKDAEPNVDLLQRVSSTTMVLGVMVEPSRDKEGRVEDVVGAIQFNTKSLMFFKDNVYDENSELIIGPGN